MGLVSDQPDSPATEPPPPPLRIFELDPGEILFVPDSAKAILTNISPSLQSFTMLYDFLASEIGPGTMREGRRQIYLWKAIIRASDPPPPHDASLPAEITLRLSLRGFAFLEHGVGARLTLMVGDANHVRSFGGPIDSSYRWDVDYHIKDIAGLAITGVEERCAFVLALTTSASNPNSRGLITLDSIDGGLLPSPATHNPAQAGQPIGMAHASEGGCQARRGFPCHKLSGRIYGRLAKRSSRTSVPSLREPLSGCVPQGHSAIYMENFPRPATFLLTSPLPV